MRGKPTDRQTEILTFIKEFRKENGFSPTIREIGVRFGIKTLRGVTGHLHALEAKGLLTITPGVQRSFVPTEEGEATGYPTPGFFRVVSDGSSIGTRVLSPSGEEITEAVVGVEIKIRPKGVYAVLTVFAQADVLIDRFNTEVDNIGTGKVDSSLKCG
jgi:hypothetical protein